MACANVNAVPLDLAPATEAGKFVKLLVTATRAYDPPDASVPPVLTVGIDDYGTDLMRKAFHERTGPLTDQSLPKAEREGFAHLFAGAIGAYKNPHSHRKVTIDDLREAQRQLLQASHLLHIVDAAKARQAKKP